MIKGFIGCPGSVEPGPDGGSDGPRPVLAGQPDLGGGVGERLSGRAGVEVAVGDQFTGPQARPKQQPVPFAAAQIGLAGEDGPRAVAATIRSGFHRAGAAYEPTDHPAETTGRSGRGAPPATPAEPALRLGCILRPT